MADAVVTAAFEQGDGTDLRHVRIDGTEVAARIYFAMRDEVWGTAKFDVLSRDLTETATGFELALALESADPRMPLTVGLRYVADGARLTASFEAVAGGEFRYNRIGICVLHPIPNHVGMAIAVEGGTDDIAAVIPAEITPQFQIDGVLLPMFGTDFARLRISLADGDLAIDFDGDTWEIEDQRNWTDASFKSYSTPLRLGTHDATAGERFAQTVTLRFAAAAEVEPLSDPVDALPPNPPADAHALVLGEEVGPLPPVGVWTGPPAGSLYRPPNGFPVLNRDRPDARAFEEFDAVSIGLDGSVHAADDDSVIETASVHGTLAKQVIELTHGLPLHLGPLDYDAIPGEWRDADGYTPAPAASPADPRRTAAFGAAWVVASLASVAGAGAASIGYYDGSVAGSPAGDLLEQLAALEGQPVRLVSAHEGVAAIAIGSTVFVANTTARAATVILPDGGARELGGWAMETLPLS